MKARISNLAKTAEEWLKLNFTPMLGELIIYLPDSEHKYSRIKIGDGKTILQDLPFIIDEVARQMLESHQYSECFDAGRITDYLK